MLIGEPPRKNVCSTFPVLHNHQLALLKDQCLGLETIARVGIGIFLSLFFLV